MDPTTATAETIVIETIDYTGLLQAIESHTAMSADAGRLIAGFLLFFVIVVLCYFGYKFFRIFF